MLRIVSGPPFHRLGEWLALVVGLSLVCPAAGQISCNKPPPAPPKRISAGEGFPPLPLPVTPLRRTERKRDPAPPTLMVKVNVATRKETVTIRRRTARVWDWVTPAGDMKHLFGDVRHCLGIRYGAQTMRLNSFQDTPDQIPILYFTSRDGFHLSEGEREKLRRYVISGGYIIGAAGNGSPEFSESFEREMQALFPDRPWYVLPPEHPVYHSYFQIDEVMCRTGPTGAHLEAPRLEGLNIGCRTAIILSRRDLSCGWDNHTHPDGTRVMPEDAKRLGVNLTAYCLSYFRLGQTTGLPVQYRETGDQPADIQIAQLRHSGDWDPTPLGVQDLLRELSRSTTGSPSYERIAVDPDTDSLAKYPLLFMTGHLDFHFSNRAVARLRSALLGGSFLLISDCCDRVAFDHAVRRELARILPNHPLQPLPASHPVYTARFDLVKESGKVSTTVPGGGTETTVPPVPLEGITIDGTTRVIYCRAPLAASWEDEDRPFIQMIDPTLARHLGVNIVVYAITH